MEFDKVIRERCSVRRFSDREISKEVIDKILEAGRIAPKAKNIQPFKIYFVSSEEAAKLLPAELSAVPSAFSLAP